MRMPALFVGALCAIVFLTVTRAAQTLKVDQVMTPQEMRETGIASLSIAERQAFDAWLLYTSNPQNHTRIETGTFEHIFRPLILFAFDREHYFRRD
jgi:hypothetical protein